MNIDHVVLDELAKVSENNSGTGFCSWDLKSRKHQTLLWRNRENNRYNKQPYILPEKEVSSRAQMKPTGISMMILIITFYSIKKHESGTSKCVTRII